MGEELPIQMATAAHNSLHYISLICNLKSDFIYTLTLLLYKPLYLLNIHTSISTQTQLTMVICWCGAQPM